MISIPSATKVIDGIVIRITELGCNAPNEACDQIINAYIVPAIPDALNIAPTIRPRSSVIIFISDMSRLSGGIKRTLTAKIFEKKPKATILNPRMMERDA